MDFNRITIRTLSILGQRGAFGQALTEFAKDNNQIVALSADLINTSGLDRFYAQFPDRTYNVGIAESNLLGVAAGLADNGLIPFATTFANFATLRACEWVRHFMGYMKSNVKLVGFGGGFAMGLFGNTHYGIEDISAIRAIPNITILSPADGVEVVKCVECSIKNNNPTYIRLTGVMNNPIVHSSDIDFSVGKAIKLLDGEDIAIFATGSMVAKALKVAKELATDGVSCLVVDVHTIKPIDKEIIEYSKNKKLIVTIEEHGIVGGLGSEVLEYLNENGVHSKVLRLGIPKTYNKAGSYEYMLQTSRLTEPLIKEDILKNYNK